LQGEHIKVAARIRSLDIYSGHADAAGLLKWAQARAPIRGSIFLTHGEPESRDGLQGRLQSAGVAGKGVIAPLLDACFRLEGAAAIAETALPPRIPVNAPASHDWHNARADFLNRLAQALQDAPDDDARAHLIAKLETQL